MTRAFEMKKIMEFILETNKIVTGNSIIINNNIGSVFSALPYLNNDYDKISSIIRCIIKNHYFQDGNKRTAFIVLKGLCRLLKMHLDENNLENKIIDIASHPYTTESVSKILFFTDG